MSDPQATVPAFAGSAGPAEAAVPDFYKPENYRAEDSVGYLMRRIITTVGQAVDGQLWSRAARPIRSGCRCYKLHLGKATTVAELARECELDAGAMTRLLDRLEAKGLCRRVRSVTDRRVVNIELTDEGRAAAAQVPARAVPGAERIPRRLQRSRMAAAQGLPASHPRQRAGLRGPRRKEMTTLPRRRPRSRPGRRRRPPSRPLALALAGCADMARHRLAGAAARRRIARPRFAARRQRRPATPRRRRRRRR